MLIIFALRSLLFYLGFYSSLLIYACLCLIIGPFLTLPQRYPFFLCWNHFVVFWLKFSCGIRVKINGRENIPNEAIVIVSNHQSPWETIYLYIVFNPVSAILKRELLSIPFFGWALSLLKPIAIDRNRKFRARNQLLQQGKEKLSSGISVLIFPEGTRVSPGVHKPYQTGGSALAIEEGVKILPVAHDAGHYWPSGKFLKKPGTIRLVIGQALDSQGREVRELNQEIEQWIRQAL